MSVRIEWMNAPSVEEVYPKELGELAPDGNDDGDYGLAITADECTMVYGDPDSLERFARDVRAAVNRIWERQLVREGDLT